MTRPTPKRKWPKYDQYWGKPKRAKVVRGGAASWYYVDEGGIRLHVQPQDANHIEVRLTRSELARYLKWTTT